MLFSSNNCATLYSYRFELKKKLFCDVRYAISIILTCRKSEDTVHKATKKDGEQMLLVQHILFYYSYVSP